MPRRTQIFVLSLAIVLAAALLASASVSITGSSSGAAYLWDLSTFENGAVPYLVNPSQPAGAIPINPSGTSPEALVSVVRSAFQIWQDVSSSTIRYTYQGTTTRLSGLDGFNVVTFTPAGTISASGVTLISAAIAPGTVRIPGGPSVVATFAGQIIDADIVLNPQTNFSIAEGALPSGQIPLEGTVMHEVGHFSGLDHSGVVGSVMYGFFNLGRGRINRAPKEDDILGISVSYPTPEFSASTATISGTVSGTGGTPVFGAQVVAIDSTSGRIAAATMTGVQSTLPDGTPSTYSRSSGRYVLKGLPPGSYSLIAEPLDGPSTPSMGGVFAAASGGASSMDIGFQPSALMGPLRVTAGESLSMDIPVIVKPPAAPNLGAAPSAAPAGQAFVSPAEIETGTSQTISLGSNENLTDGNTVAANTTFSVSGSGLTLGAATAATGFLRLPITAAADALPSTRLLSTTTQQGTSVISGGVIVIPPATSFAQFANGAGNTSTTVVLNPSSVAPATGRLVLRDDEGNAAKTGFLLSTRDNAFPADQESVTKTSFDFVVAPLGSMTIQSDGAGGLVSGSATLRATQAVGGIIKFGIPGLGTAGVERSALVSRFITPVRRDSSINTGIAIANATGSAFNVTLSLRNRAGVPAAAEVVRPLPANGHLAAFITELFPDANLTNFDGTLVVNTGNSTRLITGTALELGASPGEFTTLPVTGIVDTSGSRILRFAQFANGGGVRSDVVITNASTNAALNAVLEFFDDSGNPLPAIINSSAPASRLDFTIPPLGSRTFSSDGLGALFSGWARVTSDRAAGGVIRFSLPGLGIAGVGTSDALEQGFIIPITSNTVRGLDTGVALINAGDAAANVSMVLRNAAGVPVTGGTFSVNNFPPRGHLARMARQLFPSATLDDFEGTLSVVVQTTGGKISGTALELGSSAGQFTTLPVVGSSRVDLQACKLEYSIVSPK